MSSCSLAVQRLPCLYIMCIYIYTYVFLTYKCLCVCNIYIYISYLSLSLHRYMYTNRHASTNFHPMYISLFSRHIMIQGSHCPRCVLHGQSVALLVGSSGCPSIATQSFCAVGWACPLAARGKACSRTPTFSPEGICCVVHLQCAKFDGRWLFRICQFYWNARECRALDSNIRRIPACHREWPFAFTLLFGI